MLQVTLIGNCGAEPQTKSQDGKQFTTFRVAHNDRWTDAAGVVHDSTVWVDVIMNDRPKVCEFIKQGTTLCVIGSVKLRVYSSEKDRCMKCGMTVNARQVELVGGKPDPVPARLFDQDGVMHTVSKYYFTPTFQNGVLVNIRAERFVVNEAGWIMPENVILEQQQQEQQQKQLQQQQEQQQQQEPQPQQSELPFTDNQKGV